MRSKTEESRDLKAFFPGFQRAYKIYLINFTIIFEVVKSMLFVGSRRQLLFVDYGPVICCGQVSSGLYQASIYIDRTS